MSAFSSHSTNSLCLWKLMFTDNQRSGTKSTELIYLPRLQGWQLFQHQPGFKIRAKKKVQFSPRLSISVNARWKDVAATRDGNWQNEICFSFLQQCVVRIEIEIDELEVCVLVKWFLFCVSSVVWLNNFALCFIELVLETRICNCLASNLPPSLKVAINKT